VSDEPGTGVLNIAGPFFWLLAYLVIVYIRPQEFVPSLLELPVVPVSLSLATLAWLSMQKKRFVAPQHMLMLFFFGVLVLSVLATGWVSGAIDAGARFLPTLLLFYLLATSVDSIGRFKAVCFVLSATSAVIALHSIDQFSAEEGIGWTGAQMVQGGRIAYLGILSDPNDLAMSFLISLPLTLYLAKNAASRILRLLAYGVAGLTLYGVYLCNSRGGILGLFAMLGVSFVRRFGVFRGLVLLPPAAVALAFLSPSRSAEMGIDESAAGRVDAWYTAFTLFSSHPLLGVGTERFTEHNPLTAHNSYVLALAELGSIGYFIWFSILVLSAMMLWRVMRSREPTPAEKPAGTAHAGYPEPLAAARTNDCPRWIDIRGAAGALAYSYVGALVTAFFLSRTYVVFLYVPIALIVAIYQLALRCHPKLERVRFGPQFGRLVLLSTVSIACLWGMTRVLVSLE